MNKAIKVKSVARAMGWKSMMFKSWLFVLFVSAAAAPQAGAEVVINEIMAKQTNVILDPFNEYSDYIEIYNPGPGSVNLNPSGTANDYFLFDLNSNKLWAIPTITLNVGQYLKVWANDRNDPLTFSTNFKLDSAGESIYLLKGTALTTIDFVTYPKATKNESYGRFPNGVGGQNNGFKRMNIPTPGVVNQNSTFVPTANAGDIRINEVVTSNLTGLLDYQNTLQDWVELYNSGAVPVTMDGLRIEDDSSNWVIPNVTPDIVLAPGEYLFLWASDKDVLTPQLHTDFQLTSAGETLTFYNTDGATIIDSVAVAPIVSDHSYGRFPNGTGAFQELSQPTGGSENINTPIVNNPDHACITINETVPANISGLRDFENDFSDWVELYNKCIAPAKNVDLQGLRIADSEKVWEFKDTKIMNSGTYLTVFASGKNIPTGPEYHANWSISSTVGETLQLLHKNGQNIETVILTAPTVPIPFPEDVAWGRSPDGTGNFIQYAVPTPSALNQVLPPPSPTANADQIVINEVVSNNSTGLLDQDGAPSDWIEFYNKGTTTINLEGLKIKDSTQDGVPNPTTWVFPNVSMAPGDYLILLASGKNKLNGELHTNFQLTSSGSPFAETLTFLNKNNAVISTVNVVTLQPDESYGRLPNGTGNFQVFTTPTPAALNTTVVIDPNPDAALITINEVSSNENTYLDEDGTPQDWVELYNPGVIAVDLQNLKLRDSGSVWSFPGVTLGPKQYLLVFASSKNKTNPNAPLHTNFAISATGETIQLLNTNSELIAQVVTPSLPVNQSYGRFPNGGGAFRVFTTSTPAKKNILTEAMGIEALYILTAQNLVSGPAYGAFNNIVGGPTEVVPLNNALAIMALKAASDTLDNPASINQAQLAADYLVSVQQADGSWANKYNFATVSDPAKSAAQTAAVMVALYKLGFKSDRYDDMKEAANFLLTLQDPLNKTGNNDGLVGHGKNVVGNYETQRWVEDNAWASQAFCAAANWAYKKKENTLGDTYKAAAENVRNGIDTWLYSTPKWHAVINASGAPQCNPHVPAANCNTSSWMSYAPQLLDAKVNGVNDPLVGGWIESQFQDASNAVLGFVNKSGSLATRQYPRLSFQSILSWMDIGDNANAVDTLDWTGTTGLKNSLGGWVDYFEISPIFGETPVSTDRLIDTSSYAIMAYNSGYDFTAKCTSNVKVPFLPGHQTTLSPTIVTPGVSPTFPGFGVGRPKVEPQP